MIKRIMVDMSATLIHHGHVRILQAAAEHGRVIVGLTTDNEIEQFKGYTPELEFEARREILLALRFVDEVVSTPWLITETILDHHRIDLLVHGNDNQNNIAAQRLIILPRTLGVSSTELRLRSVRSLRSIKQKLELSS
jgi:cytidyltransferase-like protein